jgi:hypothetical protein
VLKNETFKNPMNKASNGARSGPATVFGMVAQLIICDARDIILLRFGLHSLLLAPPHLRWGRDRLRHA